MAILREDLDRMFDFQGLDIKNPDRFGVIRVNAKVLAHTIAKNTVEGEAQWNLLEKLKGVVSEAAELM